MRIAISGVGIAGPTLAWWLREYGFEPVLFEKSPELRKEGYLVDFWGAGLEVLEKMRLLKDLESKSYKVKNVHCFNGQGRKSSKIDISSLINDNYGEFLSVKRGDISSIIFKACNGIETKFGTHIVSIEEKTNGVSAKLSDGSTDKFDLIIGADGLHSHTRSLVFNETEFQEFDLNTYVAAFSLPEHSSLERYTYGICIDSDRQAARVRLNPKETLVMFTFKKDLIDKFPVSLEERKDALKSVFKDIKWEVPEILSELINVKEIYFDKVSQIKMSNWYKGRVALIGDAVACPSVLMGQGSIFAIVEAYILAGELYKAKGDHTIAFPAWQEKLKNTIERKQKVGLTNLSALAPKDIFKKYLSTITMKIASTPIISKFIGAGIFKDKFDLPNYKL